MHGCHTFKVTFLQVATASVHRQDIKYGEIYTLCFRSQVRLTLGSSGCISGSRWYSCHSRAASVSVPVDVGPRGHPAGNCVRGRHDWGEEGMIQLA